MLQEKVLLIDVDRIVALDSKPILRNLLITQAYAELSDAMARLLGRENITWPTMAAWSSKSVGGFIRGEELPAMFRQMLLSSDWLHESSRRLNASLRETHPGVSLDILGGLQSLASCILEDVSRYLIQGNRIVFEEVARLLTAFVQEFSGDTKPDERKLRDFLARYPDGPVRPDQVTVDASSGDLNITQRGGQGLLKSAMANYYRAMHTTDSSEKAQLILLANGEIGLHEQTRLQPYLEGSMNAPWSDLIYNANHNALLERVADQDLRGKAHVLMDRLLPPFADGVERLFRDFSTAALMTLKLPDSVLRLGFDLMAAPGHSLFPEVLKNPTQPELCSVLAQYGVLEENAFGLGLVERIQKAVHGVGEKFGFAPHTAAHDWTDLTQRMRFILTLFRSRQQDGHLFQQPFSAQQRVALLEGQVPEGPL
ncbi:hypothetical protein JRI60_46420 [Archangium violaceum]|uniref:hypothetical protein n=1 Tax=Archangium violaceum TaxID=83451 RepID=UPI00194E3B65|nr:hypothetical protein [Archangium violaceum]QRN96369.1 hypothetical protein JRI60_46420 [Archangium violaceum]